MTEKEKNVLLSSQQGELDAVLMYRALAVAVNDERDRETFLRLAAEEGGHAAAFYRLTGVRLAPKDKNAKLLVAAYGRLGRKVLYPLIAAGEYLAARNYKRLIPAHPELLAVRNDEKRHGDEVKALLR